ncbi:MAG: hypothetical protein HQL65_03105 [Magnetococcales bacterium]|nr:hypothetical protein [Magnetococcales bacterium]
MKTSELKKRMQKDRPISTISLRMPEDVVEEMKQMAPLLGFSGYQPLIRHYIGQGLRVDKERLENSPLDAFIKSLKQRGIDDTILSQAMADIHHGS